MGNVFGSVLASTASGFLIPRLGWQSTFYGIILMSLCFSIFWFLLIADYPSKSWWCSKKEVEFIMDSHHGSIEQGKVNFKDMDDHPYTGWAQFHSCPHYSAFLTKTISKRYVKGGKNSILTMGSPN